MKYSSDIALFVCLFLAMLWWNWPAWGHLDYWFPTDKRIAITVGCQQGQLTTMRHYQSAAMGYLALNKVAALAIFEKPKEFLDSYAEAKVKRLFVLIDQGHVVRIPEKKFVRYVRPSAFANWVVEVEVFRRGDRPLRGFAYWEDLDCWKV